MKHLRKILMMTVFLVGLSVSASAQKDDQKKPPPKENPPVVNPKDKQPKDRPRDNDRNNDNTNRPRRPQFFLSQTETEIISDFI